MSAPKTMMEDGKLVPFFEMQAGRRVFRQIDDELLAAFEADCQARDFDGLKSIGMMCARIRAAERELMELRETHDSSCRRLLDSEEHHDEHHELDKAIAATIEETKNVNARAIGHVDTLRRYVTRAIETLRRHPGKTGDVLEILERGLGKTADVPPPETLTADARLEALERACMAAIRMPGVTTVLCREGGGPEDLGGSVTLTIARLVHDLDTARAAVAGRPIPPF